MDGLTLVTDKKEYSRHEPSRCTVKVRLLPSPATDLDDTAMIVLRRKGGPVVFSKEITLSGDYPKGHIESIDLTTIVDDGGIPLCIRDNYRVEVYTPASGYMDDSVPGRIVATTEAFRVALITAEEMRSGYCFGIPLYSSDTPMVKRQPTVVTGVTVTALSENTRKGVYSLAYTPATTDPAAPATLTWGGGPAIAITGSKEILLDARGAYAEVDVETFDLPDAACAEGMVVDKQYWDDAKIQTEIDKAIAEVENIILKVGVEPYRVATEPYYSAEGAFFDKEAQPFMFTNNDFNLQGKGWRLDIPVHQLQRVDEISGYIGNSKAFELGSGALAVNTKSGTLDVLPYNSQYSYFYTFFMQINFWGVREYIANFWRYAAVAGLKVTPPDVLKLIGAKAAVTIMSIAGQAYRGGFSSESNSKDGVSRSVSYTASATYGIYSASITDHTNWIKENAPLLRNQYRGISMVVL